MSDSLQYLTMSDHSFAPVVRDMMAALYAEDAPASGNAPRSFSITISHLLDHPDRGRIDLFVEGSEVIGYALLIPYWSNEFGGTIVFVDELYVVPRSRGRGVGRGLFAMIEGERPYGAVAVFLEVSSTNHRARKLYESLGLTERTNSVLVKRLP